MNVPPIDTKISARETRNGMIIETRGGVRIEVEDRLAQGAWCVLSNGYGRSATVKWDDLVTVLGYFNPEHPERH
jgi:hypothetical protein